MPKVIHYQEVPQTVVAIRKAGDSFKDALSWLKISRRNADDSVTKKQIQDMENTTAKMMFGLDTIKDRTGDRNLKSRGVRANMALRLQ